MFKTELGYKIKENWRYYKRLLKKLNIIMFGKVAVVNIWCFRKVIYNCMLLPVPKEVIEKKLWKKWLHNFYGMVKTI